MDSNKCLGTSFPRVALYVETVRLCLTSSTLGLNPVFVGLDMIWNEWTVVANVIAGCKSDVVRSNKRVHKSTSSEGVQYIN